MGYLWLLVVIVVLLAAAMAAMKLKPPPGAADSLPYRRKDYLLTKAERSFYEVLRQTVGQHWVVFVKVRLLDLVWLPKGTTNPQAWRNRVQSKHVDFVLCSPEVLAPSLVIELDDASHEREDRQDRDAFLNQVLKAAGIPILHVPARRGYVQRELAEQIQSAIASDSVPVSASNVASHAQTSSDRSNAPQTAGASERKA